GVLRALDALDARGGRYGSAAEPRTGPMAVLDPGAVGRHTSACLVEVDYLSNPRSEQRLRDPAQRRAIGAAIASAIQDHLARTGRHRPQAQAASDDGGYFTDTDQLDAYMRDTRASSTDRVSTVADGQAVVDQYLSRGSRTVWPNIDVATCAQQIKDRCANHRLFQQGNLNLCRPVAIRSATRATRSACSSPGRAGSARRRSARPRRSRRSVTRAWAGRRR